MVSGDIVLSLLNLALCTHPQTTVCTAQLKTSHICRECTTLPGSLGGISECQKKVKEEAAGFSVTVQFVVAPRRFLQMGAEQSQFTPNGTAVLG